MVTESGSGRRQGSQMLQRSWGKPGRGRAHACTAGRAGVAVAVGAHPCRDGHDRSGRVCAPAPRLRGVAGESLVEIEPTPAARCPRRRRPHWEEERGTGRERVRKDSRPLDGLTGETPATNPNRTVHIVFLLDAMAIGLTSDMALSGTCGLVQDSYIEICR